MRRRIWRNSGQDPQVLSGLDLIAKIWPESDSVYDLTAIDYQDTVVERSLAGGPKNLNLLHYLFNLTFAATAVPSFFSASAVR